MLVLVRDEQDRLGHMADLVHCKTRLIRVDQRDVVRPGNVAMIRDDEIRRQRDVARSDAATRNGGADRGAVQHAGERQIADVLRGSGNLGVAVFAPDVPAYRGHGPNVLQLAAGNAGHDLDDIAVRHRVGVDAVQQDLVIESDVVDRVVKLARQAGPQPVERLDQLANGRHRFGHGQRVAGR